MEFLVRGMLWLSLTNQKKQNPIRQAHESHDVSWLSSSTVRIGLITPITPSLGWEKLEKRGVAGRSKFLHKSYGVYPRKNKNSKNLLSVPLGIQTYAFINGASTLGGGVIFPVATGGRGSVVAELPGKILPLCQVATYS